MINIEVSASRKYTVSIGEGLLNKVGEMILKLKKPGTVVIVTDDIVDSLYSAAVMNSLENNGYTVKKFVFPNGEQSKNLDTYTKILGFFADSQLTRTDFAVALGGGVVGDITGFAAATFLRGIDFVQVPTTLLAAVDSSVGGKTGVDLPEGKNLVGAFHQPIAVICDTNTLKTLPDDIFSAGIAEAIKSGAIRDEKLFQLIENGDTAQNITDIISGSVSIKRDIVEADEHEAGDRKLLNFGHTIGHAIEKLSNFEISHGHAVAVGMIIASRIAEKTGFAIEPCTDRIIEALQNNSLPTECKYNGHELATVALADKKRSGGNITLILPRQIGCCAQMTIPVSLLEETIALGMQ
ncbi:MAG: 3-dehydroquinate synthase [Clostridiales bacterium GWF2_38_85]|nr:MAG: 3-dehydroquinate synthase [Clostridiales bacterium GWF2_38_85]HBL85435.1 3-dehydroquinate synthase [Clostridiales bacterium]